jgi:GntR family transcriptional regulator
VFHVDLADPTPVEDQLVRTIRSAVGAGALTAGDLLPTVRQLAVELRLNPNAVAAAYETLDRQGVIETRRGVGTRVCAPPESIARSELIDELVALEDSFLKEATALGFSLDDVIIHLDGRRR